MKRAFLAAGATAVAAFLSVGAANAAVYTLSPTTNNNGNTVAATADITASGDLLTIVLTNLSPSLSAPNQGLSDILIDFSTDITSLSGFTQSGSLINVNADGSTTAVAGSPDNWAGSVVGGNLYLTALTGGQPEHMIAPSTIGNPNGGVPNFNPYIDTTGTFTLTLAGASNLTISGVSFSFGTSADEFSAPGDCVSGCGGGGNEIPEPSTWALMILGFGGAGAMLRRRKHMFA